MFISQLRKILTIHVLVEPKEKIPEDHRSQKGDKSQTFKNTTSHLTSEIQKETTKKRLA